MSAKKKSKKPESKPQKEKSLHYIELLPHTFEMLQELKSSFEEITDTKNIEDDDVINVLIQGFIQSTQAHEGGCCSEDGEKKEGCCGGSCGGSCS